MKEQRIDAFIAALLWEGVTEQQIDSAMTYIKHIRLGEDISRGSEEILTVAQIQGQRFRDMEKK